MDCLSISVYRELLYSIRVLTINTITERMFILQEKKQLGVAKDYRKCLCFPEDVRIIPIIVHALTTLYAIKLSFFFLIFSTDLDPR
jgi:hypothetical protein